jgi:hypothetical protein
MNTCPTGRLVIPRRAWAAAAFSIAAAVTPSRRVVPGNHVRSIIDFLIRRIQRNNDENIGGANVKASDALILLHAAANRAPALPHVICYQ